MENSMTRSTVRVNEYGQLQTFEFEAWVDVEGFFARDEMVAHVSKAFKGKLTECETLNTFIYPLMPDDPCLL